MKKTAAKVWNCVLSVIFVVCFLCSCGGHNTSGTTEQEFNVTPTEKRTELYNNKATRPSEVDLILDRKIFAFKDNFPELYTKTIDISTTNAYQEDWTFRSILNDQNFDNIVWEVSEYNSEITFICFGGNSKLMAGKPFVALLFGIHKNKDKPIALEFDCDGTKIGTRSFENIGEASMEIVAGDASVSVMVTLLAKNVSEIISAADKGLFNKLDYSKAWLIEYLHEGEIITEYFVFEENGNCYLATSWGYEVVSTGAGTYSTNGNVLTLKVTLNREYAREGIYRFNSASNTLTVVSDDGILGAVGETYLLEESFDNDISKIKGWATSVPCEFCGGDGCEYC